MSGTVVWVDDRATGGHFALQGERAKQPFKNNMTECRAIALRPDDVVADVGAFIGEYSMLAAAAGVREVLAYEASPATFRVLKRNCETRPLITPQHRAIVGTDEGHVTLHLSKGIGATNSIAKGTSRHERVTVPALRYERAVEHATVVKVDVEGAEYGFDLIQPQLRAMIVEWHVLPRQPWREMANERMDAIERAGFTRVRRPEFRHGWDMSGCWERR